MYVIKSTKVCPTILDGITSSRENSGVPCFFNRIIESSQSHRMI